VWLTERTTTQRRLASPPRYGHSAHRKRRTQVTRVAMAQLRAFFDANPSIWKQYSDFTWGVQRRYRGHDRNNRLDRELWRKRVEEVRNGLLEPDASLCWAKMLIERIAMLAPGTAKRDQQLSAGQRIV